MKKVIIIAGIVSVALSACVSTKNVTYNDDVYVNPKEDRLEKERIAAEKKKQQEELAKKDAEERAAQIAAQKAKDDANPLYKDPNYDKDDYYDYQYASRIRRFNQPVSGVGYYDNYYTNYYYYNGNPGMYGTSIYSGYNYWGNNYGYGCNSGWPSSYFGVNYGWGQPNYGYNSYGYNPYGGYGYNPYGYGSSSYWMGYNQGYNNGFYNGYYGYGYPYGNYYGGYGNGWGYYNAFDANSGYSHHTNAPRSSHDGGNGGRVSGPGLYNNGLAQKYVQEVQVAQALTPKFDNELRNVKSGKNSGNSSLNSGSYENINNTNTGRPDSYYSNETNPKGNSGNGNFENINTPKNTSSGTGNNGNTYYNSTTNTPKNTGYVEQPHYNNSNPVKSTNEPVKIKDNNSNPKGNIFDAGTPTFNNGGNNTPSGNSPRNSGGNSGGGTRPR